MRRLRLSVRGRGFTLLEMLVAVAAVTLIAVGLAQVFSTAGETVRAGRRSSNLNAAAALIERQLREDVERMTRAGFLVIVNEEVNGVPVVSGATARARRVDQLMFFASGEYASAREPTFGVPPARGKAARIWYGHGLRRGVDGANAFAPVNLNDDNSSAAWFGQNGPNRFASDWVLMRHLAVLAPPRSVQFAVDNWAASWADNRIQVSLTPAAISVFRNLADTNPGSVNSGTIAGRNDVSARRFASGAVDVAATDLSEIRTVVMTPYQTGASLASFSSQAVFAPDGGGGIGATGRGMQRWMLEALPAGPATRVRFETTPPNLVGTLVNGLPWGQDFQRGDQMMLSSSNFAAACTEFVVEWSFGLLHPAGSPEEGELIWHGLERNVQVGGTARRAARPYAGTPSGVNRDQVSIAYRTGAGGVAGYRVRPELIHSQIPGGPRADRSLASLFGYVDPTFNPQALGAGQGSIAWAWPRLIRVTVTLTDPASPGVEQAYQFVFEVPQGDPEGRF